MDAVIIESMRRWQRANWARRLGLTGWVVLLGACTAPPPENPPAAPAASAPRPAPTPAPSAPQASVSRNLDDYKREIATHIHAHSPQWIHDQRPQALLRAVVVARIKVDGAGRAQAEVVRSRDADMSQRMLQSVRAASPFPAPPRPLAKTLSTTGYTETWLFNSDGRFQVRTIAQPQLDQ